MQDNKDQFALVAQVAQVHEKEQAPKETLEANRVKSALEHRKLVYKELSTFEQILLYHKEWLEQTPVTRLSQVTPDPTTLDPRGDDLPLDKLHALATTSQVRSVASRAAAAMEGDRGLLHVDRYVYWYDTKAPPAEWNDILNDLLALHELNTGFLVTDLGLPPSGSSGTGYTWVTGFVEEKWAHYVKYALDTTMTCSAYVLDAAPWLNANNSSVAEGFDRLTHVVGGCRHFRRFPTEEPAKMFRKFMLPINGKLVEHMSKRCVLMTVIDHQPNRRNAVLKLLGKILRNRNKSANPQSKSKGLNFYVPAIQGLRKERDESQRIYFVKGIQQQAPHINIKSLLEMPLNELRVKFWTFNQDTPTQTATALIPPTPTPAPAPAPAPAAAAAPAPAPSVSAQSLAAPSATSLHVPSPLPAMSIAVPATPAVVANRVITTTPVVREPSHSLSAPEAPPL